LPFGKYIKGGKMQNTQKILTLVKEGKMNIDEALVLLDSIYQQKDVDKQSNVRKVLIDILSSDGDKVKVNIPLPLIQVGLTIMEKINKDIDLRKFKGIDLHQIVELVKQGELGELVDIQSADGDIVKVSVQ